MAKAAPPEVKDAFRLVGVRGISPSGTIEQDDMDNWQECTWTCGGVVSRRFQLTMQMALGHEQWDEDLMAWTSDFRMSGSSHRAFYRRWAQLMAAEAGGRKWEGWKRK